MSYTKGKWEITEKKPEGIPSWVISTEKNIIAWVPKWTSNKANARRICQCVNNFNKLLEALEQIRHNTHCLNNENWYQFKVDTIKFAKTVIAEAEKG